MVVRPAPTSNDLGGGVHPLFPGCFEGRCRTLVRHTGEVPRQTLIYSGYGCTASRLAPGDYAPWDSIGENRLSTFHARRAIEQSTLRKAAAKAFCRLQTRDARLIQASVRSVS